MIALEYCSGLRLGDDARKPYCFEINTPDRVFFIQASGEEDRAEWMQAIEDAIPDVVEDDSQMDLVVDRKDSRREERGEEFVARLSASAQASDNEDSEDEDGAEEGEGISLSLFHL